MNSTERILITGGSGHLAQLTIEHLLSAGAKNLITTTRNPEKLQHLTKRGVEVRPADFNDAKALAEAFRGATRLLLISTMDIGSRAEQHKNAIEAAKKAGVKYIIYTSWPNTDTSPALVAPDHAATEALIRKSGLKYMFLRNNLYAENLLHTLPNAIEMGKLYGCAADGKVAYVLRDDCAKAAAGALINAEKFENQIVDVSGPTAYSYSELMTLLSEVTGQKVEYVDLKPAEFKALAMKSGLPETFADLFVSFDRAIKKGDAAKVSDGVQRLSGESARDIHEFLKANF
jgi:NAD(P)H dehydrogenase (quinone)